MSKPNKTPFVGGSKEREKKLQRIWWQLFHANWTDKQQLELLERIVKPEEIEKIQVEADA